MHKSDQQASILSGIFTEFKYLWHWGHIPIYRASKCQ